MGMGVVGVPGSLLECFELAVTCLVVFASDRVLTDGSSVLELEFHGSEGFRRFRQDVLNNEVCLFVPYTKSSQSSWLSVLCAQCSQG